MILRLAALLVFAWVSTSGLASAAAPERPNIVVVFCDDMGWGDLGCFGAKSIRTPSIDSLARQGTRFTSFYVAQPVCSASRAALLTGCYPNRLGLFGALGPSDRRGLNTNEVTLARLLGKAGYATAMFGKWHLGRPAALLPIHQGFDEYFGLPYSNDMWPHHPTAKKGTYPELPLIEGEKVIEMMPDQRFLTQRYTDRAVQFIERNQSRPFFLYLAHSMPHVPLHVNPAFQGKSKGGIYGDVIEELDASVGKIMSTLDRLGLTKNTWVIFTSDNGPWHVYGNHAGSAGPWREGKGSVFEGGIRVPCVMRWPGHIPARKTVDAPLMTIDLLPTIAKVLSLELPAKPIDGKNAWPLVSGARGAGSPQEAYFFYYNQCELQAMRCGRWKLHFPHAAVTLQGKPGGRDGVPVPNIMLEVGLELYDLESDPGETHDVAYRHPEVVERLQRLANKAREDLGDTRSYQVGRGVRPVGLGEQP